MRKILIVLFLLFNLGLLAQDDFVWWAEKHNWDGVSHWTKYLKLSPRYMGPNAIPVPEVKNGLVRTDLEFEMSAEGHFKKGDNTYNLYSRANIPFANGKIALKFSWVPVEYYNMDTIARDERAARDYNPEGFAVGDVYIGTHIQLLKDKGRWPDMLLTINLRTASGGGTQNARFTDTPGYFFDLSLGKDYQLGASKGIRIRPYLMGGFYVWQTYRDNKRQNDAWIWGGGCDLIWEKYIWKNNVGSYYGYLDIGDKPIVFRSILESYYPSLINVKCMLQQGLQDFTYTTIRIGVVLRINREKQ